MRTPLSFFFQKTISSTQRTAVYVQNRQDSPYDTLGQYEESFMPHGTMNSVQYNAISEQAYGMRSIESTSD